MSEITLKQSFRWLVLLRSEHSELREDKTFINFCLRFRTLNLDSKERSKMGEKPETGFNNLQIINFP